MLTLVALDGYKSVGRQRYSMGIYLCECGNTKRLRVSAVKWGSPKSCGCIQDRGPTTHGMYGERIYQCWNNMKARAKTREDCEVCESWIKFEGFRDWAMVTGYTDKLILCRVGDSGDYEPGNVRWDTYQSNIQEAFAITWRITFPDKSVKVIKNLKGFCAEQHLNYSTMLNVSNVDGKCKQHRGFIVARVSDNDLEVS